MKLTVYIDILIVVNTIINYTLIKIACFVSAADVKTKRVILSSITGALFSLAIFLKLPATVSFIIKLFSVILCTLIALGYRSRKLFVKNILSLLAVNFLFSGLLMFLADRFQTIYINNHMFYININPVLLVICISGIYIMILLLELLFGISKENIYKFIIYINNTRYEMTAFYDTGFGLKDIINNKSVIMCSFDTIKNMTDMQTVAELYDFFIKGEYHSNNITTVFYSDISNKGMLPAIKPQEMYIVIDGKKTEIKNAVIAVCRQQLPDEYEIIFGKQILNRIGN